MSNFTISVAICTCNGEKYIREQIRGIVNQSLPVDEIIICDDLSTDSTLTFLEEELAASGIPYKLIVNESRLGPGLNFQKCIGCCSGDIVFLSDQDDVWMPNKVELFMSACKRQS